MVPGAGARPGQPGCCSSPGHSSTRPSDTASGGHLGPPRGAGRALVLEADEPREAHLAAHRRVDIALDPFPFTGGTATTVEALWMGVPVLTLAGMSFLARQGVGLLMNAGFPTGLPPMRTITSRARWPMPAICPASRALRGNFAQQVLASPVFDAPRFAGHFDAALRGMWQAWCAQAGKPA